jgi:hypothetical protein
MFRKRFKKAPKPISLRRKRTDNDDDEKGGAPKDDDPDGEGQGRTKGDTVREDDDDDDASAVQQAIQRTQKKQKILSSLPLTSSAGCVHGDGYGEGGRRSKATSARTGGGGVLADMNRQTITGELSILASKHQKNMEEFIEQQIAASTSTSTKLANTGGVDKSKGRRTGDDDDNVDTSVVTSGSLEAVQDEEDLYQQLARETYTGSQTTSNGIRQQDEDEGAGGAVLVGSGIAEVILPVHERLASLDRPGRKTLGANVRNKHVSSSSSAVPDGERNSLPSTTPTPVGRNMVTSLQRQQQQLQQQQQQQRLVNDGGNNSHPSASGIDSEHGGSHGRRGFAEFLGKSTSATASPSTSSLSIQAQHQNQGKGPASSTFSHRQQNRDDQVFSKFVTRHFQENRR